jgi:cation diffusion facilitator family transporter
MKAVLTALFANVFIAISKFVVSFITGSATMAAEAIHSSADCVNQLLLLIGMKRSIKEADERHAFGYGMEIHFWSLKVAVILFLLGSLFAIYEGIHKVLHPEPVQYIGWIFGLLIIALILEAKSFMVAIEELRESADGSLKKIIENTTNPSLLVIAVEDFGAITGLLLATVFTALSYIVHPIFDGIGSIVIGLILGYMSFFLSNEIRKMIVGENINRKMRSGIKKIIKSYRMVKHVNNIRGSWNSMDTFLLAVSIDIDDDLRSGDVEHIVAEMKTQIRKEYPSADPIYIECINQRDS